MQSATRPVCKRQRWIFNVSPILLSVQRGASNFKSRSEKPSNFRVKTLLKAFCRFDTAGTRSANSTIDSPSFFQLCHPDTLGLIDWLASVGSNNDCILCIIVLQLSLCLLYICQLPTKIFFALRFRLTVSLNLSFGLPIPCDPLHRLEYRYEFRI